MVGQWLGVFLRIFINSFWGKDSGWNMLGAIVIPFLTTDFTDLCGWVFIMISRGTVTHICTLDGVSGLKGGGIALSFDV